MSLRVGSSNGMRHPHGRVDCYNAGLSTLIFKRVIFSTILEHYIYLSKGHVARAQAYGNEGRHEHWSKEECMFALELGCWCLRGALQTLWKNYNKEQMSDVVIFTDVNRPAVLSIKNGNLSIYWKKFQWIHQKYSLMYFLARWLWNVPSLLSDISPVRHFEKSRWKSSIEQRTTTEREHSWSYCYMLLK